MTKSYRPKGWDKIKRRILPLRLESLDPVPFSLIEAGADAMLKLLKKDGTHFDIGEWTDDATFETEVPGTVVFIPDDEVM